MLRGSKWVRPEYHTAGGLVLSTSSWFLSKPTFGVVVEFSIPERGVPTSRLYAHRGESR